MPDSEPREGGLVGNYRLKRRLGTGGSAEVYLGEQIHLGTPAAIKLLRTQLDAVSIQKFRREARIIARLRHPHIVNMLDFGIERGVPYLIMEYAPAGSLRSRYGSGKIIPPEEVLHSIKQVAQALDYAHGEGVIHRDVKPENMLIGRHDIVLLSDFGLATVLLASVDLKTSGVAGTVAYMAPEQLNGKPVPASDQYSLAVAVYEWLCGRRPFRGSPAEMIVKQINEPPPSLHRYNAVLPARLEGVVLMALSKEPKQRYPTVGIFVSEFEHALRSSQSVVPPLPFSQGPVPARGDADFLPAVHSPGIADSSVNMPVIDPHSPRYIGSTVQIDSLSPVPLPSAPVSFTPANPPLAEFSVTPAVDESQVSSPTERPDPRIADKKGKRRLETRRAMLSGLAYLATALVVGGSVWFAATRLSPSPGPVPRPTASGTAAGQTPVASAQVQGKLLQSHSFADTVNAVDWLAGSSLVVVGDGDMTVQIWDVAANRIVHAPYKGHTDQVTAVSWRANGATFASASYDRQVLIWAVNDDAGAAPLVCRGHTAAVFAVAWSPDGRFIASGGADNTVRIWDAATGALHYTHYGHTNQVRALAWSHNSAYIASGSLDGTARVWKPGFKNPVATYARPSLAVYALAWSPDDKLIACGTYQNTVDVWEAMTGNARYSYTGHSNVVRAVAWSPDGKYIASGGNDTTVHIWLSDNVNVAYIYRGHHDVINTICWATDSMRVASGGNDRTVRVWQAVQP